ncbi:MAG TPA: TOMM precursor leader peptide-binding protein [Streptosporangiaceae bacterium]|jgi:ribosomal protein S12 methylthiotransferase accessory factor
MTASTIAPVAAASMESDRERLERHLLGSPASLPGRVRPYVAVLGDHDAIAGPPDGSVADPASYPIHLTPRSILFGPAAGSPPGSPCSCCLALRWQKLRSTEERNILESGRSLQSVAASPYLTTFALDTARQLFALLTDPWAEGSDPGATGSDASPPGIGYVYELSLNSLVVRRFGLLADPACPVCSRPRQDSREAARLTLRSRRKPSADRYRLRSIADYDLPLEGFVNPVCGMLGASARSDLACPTTAPVNSFLKLRISGRLFDVHWSGHANSYEESTTCGVFEGLERYASGQRRRFNRVVMGSYDSLRADALDPRDCGVYTDDYYHADRTFTPFAPDRPIPWVWGYSLRDERPILVPERISYYMERHNTGHNFVHECSNGCAGGSCLEEAILYGMLELIERDAFLLAWYGRAALPEIDPDTCRDPATRFMMDRIRLHDYDVRLFDNRSDLAVPVVTGVAVRRDGGLGTLCFAAGAGLDPDDAVRAALCEIASYIPTLPERVAQRHDELAAMARDFSKVAELNHHAALFGLPEMARHAQFLLSDRPKRAMAELYQDWERVRPRTLDLLDDVRFCRDRLIAAGFDVIVVDQTCPEQELVGLHNVCVIVPGLIPIDFGWHRQRALHMPRMRTAFRRAGRRTTDLADSELHLVPHPFP